MEEMTTIAIPKEMKERMKEFGNKGETYSDILVKLFECAKKRQLSELLMDEKDTISAEEALSNAKKRWQK